jgi:hypothetical protein
MGDVETVELRETGAVGVVFTVSIFGARGGVRMFSKNLNGRSPPREFLPSVFNRIKMQLHAAASDGTPATAAEIHRALGKHCNLEDDTDALVKLVLRKPGERGAVQTVLFVPEDGAPVWSMPLRFDRSEDEEICFDVVLQAPTDDRHTACVFTGVIPPPPIVFPDPPQKAPPARLKETLGDFLYAFGNRMLWQNVNEEFEWARLKPAAPDDDSCVVAIDLAPDDVPFEFKVGERIGDDRREFRRNAVVVEAAFTRDGTMRAVFNGRQEVRVLRNLRNNPNGNFRLVVDLSDCICQSPTLADWVFDLPLRGLF